METELNAIEARVLGCLIEKEMATPEYYPMTLNALANACNQKSNRHPAMALDETAVGNALYDLRVMHKLAIEATSTSGRVPKYRHAVANHWNFSPAKMGILCELLVRGPQTPGDLRAHASRLHPLADVHEVDEILRGLKTHEDGPFVVQLPREPGQRERRWSHLFSGDPQLREEQQEELSIASDGSDTVPGIDRFQSLENDMADLRRELEQLRLEFEAFKSSLD